MSRRWAAFFAATVLFNLGYNSTLPLHFDEAYYWVWSNHLQLSYFDHPPMIAWLIRAATVFGDAEWQIRLVPLSCSALAGLGIWSLANGLYGKSVANKALLIFLLSPLAQMGFSLATPDAPLILGWTAVLFFVHKAIFGADRKYYYAAGVAAGFAMLSKYTAVLLLPGLLLFLLFSSRRRELVRKELWGAIGIGLMLFLPVLIWNAGHEWSSFRFQLGHGLDSEKILNLATFAEYLGAQAVGLNLIFFLFLLYLLLRFFGTMVSDERQAFLLWPCLTVLAFFGYAALFKRTEGNWAAPAHVTGIILIAKWLDCRRYSWAYKTGIALGIMMIMVLKVPELFDFLPRQMVMKRQVLGYDTMFRTADPLLTGSQVVLAGDYKLASLAWYYLPGRPIVHVVTPSRFSQFNYWREDFQIPMDADVIFFGDKKQAALLGACFQVVTPLTPLFYQDRYISREIQVYQCRGFKIMPCPASSSPPSH
jgi:4-amino-4-deoxy-L-arabinose transferase-like glycosyltransferase